MTPSSGVKQSREDVLSLKMGLTGCPATGVKNFQAIYFILFIYLASLQCFHIFLRPFNNYIGFPTRYRTPAFL